METLLNRFETSVAISIKGNKRHTINAYAVFEDSCFSAQEWKGRLDLEDNWGGNSIVNWHFCSGHWHWRHEFDGGESGDVTVLRGTVPSELPHSTSTLGFLSSTCLTDLSRRKASALSVYLTPALSPSGPEMRNIVYSFYYWTFSFSDLVLNMSSEKKSQRSFSPPTFIFS